MTQEDLARKIGKERSVVARYELNGINMPVSVLLDIAKALKKKPIELLNCKKSA